MPSRQPEKIPVTTNTRRKGKDESSASRIPLFARPVVQLLAVAIHILTAATILGILEKWTFVDAFYFAVVVATTVGYGDLTPTRGASKLFVAVYALASVALVAGALGRFVASFAEAQRELATRAAKRMPILATMSGRAEMHGDKEHHSALLETAEKAFHQSKSRLRSTAALLFSVVVMSTFIYAKFLQKLGILDILYFVCVSMSTVGLGDLHPESTSGKIYATIWLVFASLGFANLIAVFTEVRLKKKELDITKALVSEHLSRKTFSDIDEDGDQRLSESEFLGYTICKLGKATPDEVKGIVKRFRELDADGSGFLTKEEVIK